MPFRGTLIDLLLCLVRPLLCIGISSRPGYGSRGATQYQSSTRMFRSTDDSADNRTDNGAANRIGSRRTRGLDDHALVGTGIRAARIHACLLYRP